MGKTNAIYWPPMILETLVSVLILKKEKKVPNKNFIRVIFATRSQRKWKGLSHTREQEAVSQYVGSTAVKF